MKLFKNKYLLTFSLVLLSVISLTKCKGSDEILFDQKKWMENEYSYELTRERMTGDLIDNHLNKDLCYDDLMNLLGSTASPKNKESSHIYFQLQEVRASDAEQLWVTYLDITLSKDSCYQSAKVVKVRM